MWMGWETTFRFLNGDHSWSPSVENILWSPFGNVCRNFRLRWQNREKKEERTLLVKSLHAEWQIFPYDPFHSTSGNDDGDSIKIPIAAIKVIEHRPRLPP